MAALKSIVITILVIFSLATYCDGKFGVLTAAAGGKNGSVGKYLYLLDRIWNAFENLKSIWDSFDGKPNYAAPDTSASAMLYYSLTDVMETWDAAFEDLRQTIKDRSDYMENLVVELESEARVKMEMDEFHQNLLAIRDKYRQFHSLVKGNQEDAQIKTMADFIFNYLSSGEIETLILRVYDFITPTLNTQDDFLLTLFTHHKTLEVTHHLCKLRHSPVDFFQALLTGLLSTEMHGYMLLVAGTTFLYTHQNDGTDNAPVIQYPYSLPPSEKIKIWNIRAQRRLQSYLAAFVNVMENSATDILQCPPQGSELVSDVTYLELAGFIQNVVQPHRNLVEWSGDFQHVLSFKYMRECHGIFDFEKDVHDAAVCLKEYSPRRYAYVHLPGDGHHPERCFDPEVPLRQGVLGKCFDNAVNSRSTHTVNLLPVEADPFNNMVVTGMKFVIVHGILHIQIAQGQLGPNFEVYGAGWKPVDDISDRVRASRTQVDYEGGPSGLEINRHYAVLDKTNKYFEFGEAAAEHGYVVTGLKFQLSPKNRLHVAIIARKFNPESGKLNFNSPSVTLSPIEVNYNLPVYKDRPFDLAQTDELSTTDQGYVEFDSTKWETDKGQTTVPFFDARPFDTSPPAPLLGVHTFYQYNDHFPGLISFKYRGLNYTRYNLKNLDTVNDFVEAEDGSLMF